MKIQEFYDSQTGTLTYVLFDPESKDGVVIDPVLHYEPHSGSLSRQTIDPVIKFLEQGGIQLKLILETHVHADHLSASQILKEEFPGAEIAIGEHVKKVQQTFAVVFGVEVEGEGRPFDKLLRDGEETTAGTLSFKTISCPGHTPACCTYLFNDCLFTGDVIFMPDYGTGRCDFPEGSAEDLYRSIHKLYLLPDSTRIFVGHDYRPGGRDLKFESSVGEEKSQNKHLKQDTSLEEFLDFRLNRDKELKAPRLLFPSLQVNLQAGHLPPAESNGTRYLKIPLSGDLSK